MTSSKLEKSGCMETAISYTEFLPQDLSGYGGKFSVISRPYVLY
jgi:hypothetical protein